MSRVRYLVIVTADRPRTMARAFASYGEWLRSAYTDIIVVVADGSADPSNEEIGRTLVQPIAQRLSLKYAYLGRREADALVRRACSLGAQRNAMSWLLGTAGPGATRNLAVLATAGARVLSVDDDTICRPWLAPGRQPGIALVGHRERQEFAFYHSRLEATLAVGEAGDLVAEHEAVLGKSLSQICSEQTPVVTSDSCSHLQAARRHGGTVRVTGSAIAGDSGMSCPRSMLLVGGSLRDALAAGPEAFGLALSSREVTRTPIRTTVIDDSWLMAYCCGLDGSKILPPFLPIGRNEDRAFAELLRHCEPSAFTALLPVGIIHDSTRGSRYDGEVRSATQIRLSDLLVAKLARFDLGPRVGSVEMRIRETGAALLEWAAARGETLNRDMIELATDRKRAAIGRCESLLQGRYPYPHYLRQAISDYRDTVSRSMQKPGFWVPVEFRRSGNAEPVADFRQAIANFGQCLSVWPDVWAASISSLCAGK